MTYSDFTLETTRKTLGLSIQPTHLFHDSQPIQPPAWVQDLLDKGMPLALGSEKARSEFIIVPILLTTRELSQDAIAIYSGQRIDIDPPRGLVGECDFVLALAPQLPVIQAPIACIVEAKKNDIEAGLGQCIAQMYGARLLNERDGIGIQTIYGCVTTGEVWQFLKLEQQTVYMDRDRYYINALPTILGIFQSIVANYTSLLVALPQG